MSSSEPEPDQPGIYRSEQMTLAQLFLQSEAAYQCVAELGELGLVQFRDRTCYTGYLEREIKKDQIPMLDTGENPDAPQPREMIDLEATFEKLENELREVNRNEETLKKNFSELTELKHILRKTQTFFEEVCFFSFDPNMMKQKMVRLLPSKMFSIDERVHLTFTPPNTRNMFTIQAHPFMLHASNQFTFVLGDELHVILILLITGKAAEV
ncbi:hypothetical protein TELCIR_12219 [Teladorsagia circumcincta]|uniref:V-type proton ATPase subunit a n=1 Tax=Teladorsagia circumcincta TaxID=45464 RepID=A0A2G9U7C6_TELCI|nr:hypothetical protein TELCIR_12219 [Teladorsagia circumcincta]